MKYPLIAGLISLTLLPCVAAAETIMIPAENIMIPTETIVMPAESIVIPTESIVIPVGQQAAGGTVSTPSMGMSMTAVEARFGAPVKRDPAKGYPPITRWEYGQFAVYFEADKVIHSVIRFTPVSAQSAQSESNP